MNTLTAVARIRRTLILAPLALCLMGAAAPQKGPSPEALLNMAARQQVLAERITRSYAMVGQNVLVDRANYQIEQDTKLFESQLRALQANASSSELTQNYTLLEQLWTEFQNIVKNSSTSMQGSRLAKQNEEVVWIAQQGAQMLEKQRPAARASEIVMTGQALALSQRLAKLYMLRGWGVQSEVVDRDMNKARVDFVAILGKLKASKQNTPAAERALKLAEEQWGFLDEALKAKAAGPDASQAKEHVAKVSDNLLRVLEDLGTAYLRSAL